MRIIFGRNHYSVKKVKTNEIGIYNEELKDAHYELRQKYFHLYFIPVFPLGQEWYLKRGKDLYHPHDNIRHLLEQRHSSIVDWKAFALPILIALGFGIFSISESITSYNQEKQAVLETRLREENLKKQFKEINLYSYFKFSDGYYDNFFKLKNISQDSIRLVSIEYPMRRWDTLINKDLERLVNHKLLYMSYKLTQSDTISFTIAKKDLHKLLDKKSAINQKITSKLERKEPFVLSEIDQEDDAFFFVDTPKEAESIYYFEIQNLGLDAQIDSIGFDKKENWKISKKRDVHFLEKFALKTENGTSAVLYYTTVENKKKHHLKISRANGKLSFE